MLLETQRVEAFSIRGDMGLWIKRRDTLRLFNLHGKLHRLRDVARLIIDDLRNHKARPAAPTSGPCEPRLASTDPAMAELNETLLAAHKAKMAEYDAKELESDRRALAEYHADELVYENIARSRDFNRAHTRAVLWEARARPGETWPYWDRYLGRITCWDYVPKGMVPSKTRLADGAAHQLLNTPVRIGRDIVWFPRRGRPRPAPGPRGGPSPTASNPAVGYARGQPRGAQDVGGLSPRMPSGAWDLYVGWLMAGGPWVVVAHLIGLALVVIPLVVFFRRRP